MASHDSDTQPGKQLVCESPIVNGTVALRSIGSDVLALQRCFGNGYVLAYLRAEDRVTKFVTQTLFNLPAQISILPTGQEDAEDMGRR